MNKLIFNPILPSWEYIPDVEPRIFGDRLYLYGSHDRFGGSDFCMNDYVGWSAPLKDLSDWRYEGVIYSPKADPANVDGNQNGFAPDCVQGSDGRYYLYYCLHRSSTISVAVSDTPTGPFAYYGKVQNKDGKPYGGEGSIFGFDPGILMDDGHIWLFAGFAAREPMRTYMKAGGMLVDGSYCVELAPDMLTVLTQPTLVLPGEAVSAGTGFEGHAFYEASSPRKIGDRYYLIYSSQRSHDLCYAVSDRPDGEYTYGGILVSIGDIGLRNEADAINYLENTHGGMVELSGQWYVFYHRQTNRSRYSRQCCAEPLQILSDGSITQAEVTSCGLNGGPLPGRGSYPAYIACNLSSAHGICSYTDPEKIGPEHPYFTQSGGDRERDGDQYIANLQDGTWTGFKYFAYIGDEKSISVTVRGNAFGTLCVSTAQGGVPVVEIPITVSTDWTRFSAPLTMVPGIAPLYFTYHGDGAIDFAAFDIE
ncbi:MAG: family 43 glycosylhydrolase [Oscillospiraceae bacterium]|nr:family 43 glycosylhydrolase [Oscillospiraceae bacterium]